MSAPLVNVGDGGKVVARVVSVTLPEDARNLFPICGCVRLCLTCASACVDQCDARHNGIQCQRRRGHDDEHNAEGREKSAGWLRVSWREVTP